MMTHPNGNGTAVPPPLTEQERTLQKLRAELEQASRVNRPVTIVIVVNGNSCSFDVARPSGLYKLR